MEMAELFDNVTQTATLLERMPRNRIRVKPHLQAEVVAWLAALRTEYETTARQTLRGYSGRSRAVRAGQIGWAMLMCQCLDRVARSMHETLPSEPILSALEAQGDARTVR